MTWRDQLGLSSTRTGILDENDQTMDYLLAEIGSIPGIIDTHGCEEGVP